MYSQNKEDEIILNYFGNFKGTLLDVGANDGKTFSNSLAFIQKGWGAYLFEPSSAFNDLCKLHQNNERVHTYKMGLGAETKQAILHESGEHVKGAGDKCLVSTCKEIDSKWRNVDFKDVIINIVSFSEWVGVVGNPKFDFITIDCEGMDIEVMQQIDLKQVGCKCLCIEYNSIEQDYQTIKEYCAKFGLTKQLAKNAENVIFAI